MKQIPASGTLSLYHFFLEKTAASTTKNAPILLHILVYMAGLTSYLKQVVAQVSGEFRQVKTLCRYDKKEAASFL